MGGVTNKCKALLTSGFANKATRYPDSFFLALVTASVAPNPDTNKLSDLVEIAAGNGYKAGGYPISRTSKHWEAIVQDDAKDLGRIFMKDFTITASGGPIQKSGGAARHFVLIGPGNVIGDRIVYLYDSLKSAVTISDRQDLVLKKISLEIGEAVAA